VKGHQYLVEACAALKDSGIEFDLEIVGDGPLRHRLERVIVSRGLGRCARLSGALTRAQVRERLIGADLFVLASVMTTDGRREGIPVAIMEAMAAALPVVASQLSGIPELVRHGHSGLLCPPRQVAALAGSIRRLIEDPEFARALGREGQKRVERCFNLSASVNELSRLWKERDRDEDC
jgi:glycosyltransferase involved in cell wall biosynthesis